MSILPEVQEYLGNGGLENLEASMPDTWIDQLSIVGTPEEMKSAVHRLVEAGADTVVLVPLPDKGLDELDEFAHYFLV
jgi:alkanesulfonate monooxygenase SsuD/methylene tetrahydromethanopterin reductase-like flavin-dependent oxidoreductase (luciferase family)